MNSKTIVISDYRSQWADDYEALKAQIWPVVVAASIDIQHVGSTAVPGLCAKPIIDIDIIVTDKPKLVRVIAKLEGLGYRHLGDLGIVGREAFKAEDHAIVHHLYACLVDSPALLNHLSLRDHLRNHPADRAAYGALKRNLARRFPRDIESYIKGKTAFIEGILARY